MGNALGAVARPEPGVLTYALLTFGEYGDVGVSGCPTAESRGVEFRESASSSASTMTRVVPLRGVFLWMETCRDKPLLGGTMISDKGPTFEGPRACRVRLLSVRLSRSVFSPPRTAPCLDNPAELDPDNDSSVLSSLLLAALEVSIVRPEAADPLTSTSGVSSTQLAGVGGTGPNAVTPLGGGRLVGGAMIGDGSIGRLRLCDRDAVGGGPGGGGGTDIAGCHPDCDEDLDRAEMGVSIALAEAARREFGGFGGKGSV